MANKKLSDLPRVTADDLIKAGMDNDTLVFISIPNESSYAIKVSELRKLTSLWRHWLKFRRIFINESSRNSRICEMREGYIRGDSEEHFNEERLSPLPCGICGPVEERSSINAGG